MSRLSSLYASPWRNSFLALGLLPLIALAWGWLEGPWIERGLFFLHAVLITLWLPFWLGELQLRRAPGLLMLFVSALIALACHPVIASVWVAALASMVAGEPFARTREKMAQAIVITVLSIVLFLALVPASFDLELPNGFNLGGSLLSFLLLALLALLAQPRKHRNLRQSDIILSLLFFQVLTSVAMASVITYHYSDLNYLESLLSAIAVVTGIAILINFGWRRFAGTEVLSFFWNRYLLILGSPFETLLVKFSALAKGSQSPAQYLETCFHEMQQLDWLSGIEWQAASGRGEVGELRGYTLEVEIADLSATLYAEQELRGALAMHARLLVHMLTHFYHGIKRERSLAHRTHVQAVYETGARLTHDIKNLLQGLQTLAAAGQNTHDPEAFHRLFLKQMPAINERLGTTLRKLSEPSQGQRERDLSVAEWWERLQRSYRGRDVHFEAEIETDWSIPSELFDTVAENLLENARNKRLEKRDLDIFASVTASEDGVVFSVRDNGAPVPEDKVIGLMSEPVPSEFGLGVGLYQAATLAQQQGYQLILETNLPGMVCFSLSRQS